jgi:hypothetical protein
MITKRKKISKSVILIASLKLTNCVSVELKICIFAT